MRIEKLNKRLKDLKKTSSLFKTAAVGSVRENTFGMGAALAFYAVFSLGPLLMIATAVAALIVGGDEVRSQLVSWAGRFFSVQGAKAVLSLIDGARSLRSGFAATAIGIVTLFFGATGVFSQLKRSLNAIWGVRPPPRPAVKAFLLERLVALAAACGIGLVLFLALLLSAGITALGGFLGRWLPLSGGLLYLANIILSLGIVTPLIALIFKFMPDAEVPWRSVWIGAALSAVLFQGGALAIGMYLRASGFASVYGAAGSVLAVLIWAYYSAQTVLFGAEFTKAHATAKDARPGARPKGHRPEEGHHEIREC